MNNQGIITTPESRREAYKTLLKCGDPQIVITMIKLRIACQFLEAAKLKTIFDAECAAEMEIVNEVIKEINRERKQNAEQGEISDADPLGRT